MKKIFVLLLFIACSDVKKETSLSPKEFNAKLKSTRDAIILDVRTEDECKQGMITGAKNIVYDDSFANKLGALPKDIPIFVYCAKGKRSKKAVKEMKANGFKEVYQLKGGLSAWKEANIPM